MVLDREQKKSNLLINGDEIQDMLKQKKRIAYAEKIFRDFKNKAMIAYTPS
jgi:hypothetical protein